MNYEAKIKVFNNETEKYEGETLLIEAGSIGEAEAIAIENTPEHTSVFAICESKIENINEEEKDVADPFFVVENKDEFIDEISGKEQKRKIKYLIKAKTNDDASEKFKDILEHNYGAEINIIKVQRSPITQFIEKEYND